MSVSISSSVLSSPGEKPVVAVKIIPSSNPIGVRRAFHLVLLLDTSGSMEGDRILSVIRTLHLLIDAMTSGDVLTLIGYSSSASILTQATVVNEQSRMTLHAVVDALRADGGTNMEAAFLELRSVHTNTANPAIDAVFVMTDGHINQGVVSGTGLMRILTSGVPAGTPVNTLGYGSDHNNRLLRDIAVRSRGSYNYADSAELIPAVIGDIMGGLASEVGRNGQLLIPSGWRCIELGVEESDTSYITGTLIADKPQWIVLEGPVDMDPSAEMPVMKFQWSVDDIEHIETCEITDNISSIEVVEQQNRAHVATVFADVMELIESRNYTEAKAKLDKLAAFLDTSIAKNRTFVIQMRAQVDDMLESVKPMIAFASTDLFLPPPPWNAHGLQRQMAVGYMSAAPSLGPTLSRFASNTAALGVQRGFISGGTADPLSRHVSGLQATFSSPAQRQVSEGFTQNYTQICDLINAP